MKLLYILLLIPFMVYPAFAAEYDQIVSPLIAGGIVVSSLFFVKSINDKRRIDKMLS